MHAILLRRLPAELHSYVLRTFYFPSFVLAELRATRPVHDDYVVFACRRLVHTYCHTGMTLFALTPTMCMELIRALDAGTERTHPDTLFVTYLDRVLLNE